MLLTKEEIVLILTLLREKYGFGYSDTEEDGVKVGALQAKLSIMLEVVSKRT